MVSLALEGVGLRKEFGGLVAVDDVSFRVEKGQIFGVVGPNGAGKSTLFNLVAGTLRPTGGSLEMFGKSLDGKSAHQRCWAGIGRTFQSAQLFHSHTVTESLLSARGARKRGASGWLAQPGGTGDLEALAELLELLDLGKVAERIPSQLTNLDQQRLAIGMALATGAKILLLDEPSGGLIDVEVLELMHFIRSFRSMGITVVLIDHKMRLMMELCDRIMVMSTGREIAVGTPQEISANERVLDEYLGRSQSSPRVRSNGS